MSGGNTTIAGFPSATISDLIPYSTYEVFIMAINSYGDGPEASVTAITSADSEYLFVLCWSTCVCISVDIYNS